MTRPAESDNYYECLSCTSKNSAHAWNQATIYELYGHDDEEYEEYGITFIQDAMSNPRGDTWFHCPTCDEQVYNDNLQIREVPFVDTPFASRYFSTNEVAKSLLDESW